MSAVVDTPCKCTRCGHQHLASQRKPSAVRGEPRSVCPACSDCNTYMDITPSVAWAWSHGRIEVGAADAVPPGAVAIARGPHAYLQSALRIVAKRGERPDELYVRAIEQSQSPQEWIKSWVEWCAKCNHDIAHQGVQFGAAS